MNVEALNPDPTTAIRNSQTHLRRSLPSWKKIYKDDPERYQNHVQALLASQYSSLRRQGVALDQSQAAIEEIKTEFNLT